MGRLPEAWIAPPATRELRGWVRHRAKLVGLRYEPEEPGPRRARRRRGAGADERPVRPGRAATAGRDRALAVESRSRVDSLLRVITALDFEIDLYAKLVGGRLRADPGYQAIQQIPGVGPILAAVFVAEIGDITRFHRPEQLASLGRADPETPRVRHHRAPRPDHETRLSAGALGRGRGRATRARRTPASGRPATGSVNAAAATSASWPPPGS